MREALTVVVDGDPNEAQRVAEELVDLGTYDGEVCLDRTRLSSYAEELIHKLAVWYILIALLPWDEGGRRVVVKYAHHSRQDFVRPPWRVRLPTSAGWVSLDVVFDLSYPEGSASHHFEIAIPPDLACDSLTMPSSVQPDRNTADISPSGVAHVAARFTEVARQPSDRHTNAAHARYRVPMHGLRSTTFWVCLITCAILTLGVVLPGAQAALRHDAGSAAILLAVPAAVVAVTATRTESALSAALLLPLRGTIVGCALLLLACAGSVVGQLHQPWRETLWVAGAAMSFMVAVALRGREIWQAVGGRSDNHRTVDEEADDGQKRSD